MRRFATRGGAILALLGVTAGAAGAHATTAVAGRAGRAPGATRFYLAGGQNGATEHSTLDLLNANGAPVTVRLTFYFADGVTTQAAVSVPATSQRAVPVQGLIKRTGAFGLRVQSGEPVTAQLDLTRDGQDGDDILGSPTLATRWYLAEGYTFLTFHETVALLNPGDGAAHVTLRLMSSASGPRRDATVSVPAHTQTLVDVNRLLPEQSLGAVVDSDQPIAVERSLTFGEGGYGLTARMGATATATTWYFGGGSPTILFESYLTVLNPGDQPARVTARYYEGVAHGSAVAAPSVTVAPRSRANIVRPNGDFSKAIAVTSDQPVVVERAEYHGIGVNSSPNARTVISTLHAQPAGEAILGLTTPRAQWSFAGGDDRAGIGHEFILVYNPSPTRSVEWTITSYGQDGRTATSTIFYTIGPHGMDTADAHVNPGISGPHGLVVHSIDGQPFIAEQMVFNLGSSISGTLLRGTQGFAP